MELLDESKKYQLIAVQRKDSVEFVFINKETRENISPSNKNTVEKFYCMIYEDKIQQLVKEDADYVNEIKPLIDEYYFFKNKKHQKAVANT